MLHVGFTLGVFTSTGVTGYTGIRVTFCNAFKWRKVTLLPCYRVTPVLVNTPIITPWLLRNTHLGLLSLKLLPYNKAVFKGPSLEKDMSKVKVLSKLSCVSCTCTVKTD